MNRVPIPPAVEQRAADVEMLGEGHHQALRATDRFFGGFCVFMTVVTFVAWYRGEVTWRTPLMIVVFLVGNALLSQLSLRRTNTYDTSYAIERARAVVGALIAPAAYVLVEGPFTQPWWPGFLIMSLGGAIVLGLLTGSPRWGRLLVVYYVALMLASTLLFGVRVDWYDFALNAGVLAMVGLLFAAGFGWLRSIAVVPEAGRLISDDGDEPGGPASRDPVGSGRATGRELEGRPGS